MIFCAKCVGKDTHHFGCPDHPLNKAGSSGVGTHVGGVGPERVDEVRRLRNEVSELTKANAELSDQLKQWKAAAIEREAIIVQADKLVQQFLPNVAQCFGIDLQLLNETLMAMGKKDEPK